MKFDEIEIRFKTKTGKKSRVIITPGGDVFGIMFDKEVPKDAPIPHDIKGLEIIGQVQTGDGPGVCYQVSGDPVCW